MKKILVTGAAGFIGQHCMPRLAEAGLEVHAVGRTLPAKTPSRAAWHQADLLDPAAGAALVQQLRPAYLLHLAWTAKPGEFWNSPDNLRWLAGSAALVHAFFQAGGERAVGAGTCAEYAWSEADCNEASTPLQPATVYGRSKLAAALAFAAAAQAQGRSAAWARLFFPYGPGEPPQRFIPAVIDGVFRGTPVPCTHGRQIRDFIHVNDVADALVALVMHEVNGVFNVGSGIGTSLREVAAIVQRRLQRPDLVEFGAREPPADDPPRVVADIGKIRRETGWQSRIGIEQGIAGWIDGLQRIETANGRRE